MAGAAPTPLRAIAHTGGLLSAAWVYRHESSRDHRLDLLRGWLVVAMLVDHLGGSSLFHYATGGNHFFVSAAEAFVFLSGLVMGLVYVRVIERHGLRAATGKALKRAGTLYLLAATLAIGSQALANALGATWAETIDDPLHFALAVLTLQRSVYLADVLMLYAILVALAPLALVLLQRRKTALLLAGSWGLWLASQFNWSMPLTNLTAGMGWLSPPLWQVFFFTGLALGYHRLPSQRGRRPTSRWVWTALAMATVALIVLHAATPWLPAGPADLVAQFFAKDGLRLGRLIAAFAVFPVALRLVHLLWVPLGTVLGPVLLPLGRNALLAYALHLGVTLVANTQAGRLPWFDLDSPVINTAFHVLAVGTLWAAVMLIGIVIRLPINQAPLAIPKRHIVALASNLVLVPTLVASSFAGSSTVLTTATPAAGADAVTVGLRQMTDYPAPHPTAANPRPTLDRLFSAALQRDISYRYHLPRHYADTSHAYSVIFLMPGPEDGEPEWTTDGLADALEGLHADGLLPPAIIILLGSDLAGDLPDRLPTALVAAIADDLVGGVDARYRTVPTAEGRAMTGLATGGQLALAISQARPDRFGLVVAALPADSLDSTAPIEVAAAIGPASGGNARLLVIGRAFAAQHTSDGTPSVSGDDSLPASVLLPPQTATHATELAALLQAASHHLTRTPTISD